MKTFLALAAFAFAAFFAVSPVHAEGKALTPAGEFVQKMGDKALVQLTDKTIDRAARETRTRDLLRQNFDLPTIGRFVLGTYWREATDAQKAEYMKLFENMIVQTYTTRFEQYSGQSFAVDGARDEGDRDSIVTSKILQKGGPPVLVEWRVRRKEGQMKVVDVVVENISMSVTQRSDFAAVIQRGGGKIDALLASLRDHKGAK